MNYEAKPHFEVFVLADTGGIAINGKIYGIRQATAELFKSTDDAIQWIQQKGERQTEYTVIQIYRKE
jgi:hypothetical protein